MWISRITWVDLIKRNHSLGFNRFHLKSSQLAVLGKEFAKIYLSLKKESNNILDKIVHLISSSNHSQGARNSKGSPLLKRILKDRKNRGGKRLIRKNITEYLNYLLLRSLTVLTALLSIINLITLMSCFNFQRSINNYK
jgi:hypothetical protein